MVELKRKKLSRLEARDLCCLCVHGEKDVDECEHSDCGPRYGKPDWSPVMQSCLNCKHQINDGDDEFFIDGVWGIDADQFVCTRPKSIRIKSFAIVTNSWCHKWKLHKRFKSIE